MDDRHDQPVVDGDRDTNVDSALDDQPVLAPLGIHVGVPPEALDHRLHDEGDVAQVQPLARLVGSLGRVAKSDHAGDVRLDRRVRVRDGRLAVQHRLGDALAHLRPRDDLLVLARSKCGRGRRRG